MKNKQLVSVPVDEHVVLWLGDLNKYLVVTPLAAHVIELIYKGLIDSVIVDGLMKNYAFTSDDAEKLLFEIKHQLLTVADSNILLGNDEILLENISNEYFPFRHYYQIEGKVVLIEFASEYLQYLIHPKYQHLEIFEEGAFDTKLQLLRMEELSLLFVNEELKWQWKQEEENFLLGKVAMEMLNTVYAKDDEDWLAVFHAAGISNGTACVAFSGACGAGKSTLAAIMLSQGYEVLADDFLAMDAAKLEMHAFPAAISLKGTAIEMLDEHFPSLRNQVQHSFCRSGKPMRYMAGSMNEEPFVKNLPCTAIVFIEYEKDSGVVLQEIDTISALQKLVPETWIAPNGAHVQKFLEWLKGIPCYSMQYGNNDDMLEMVDKLFRHEV